MGVSPAGLDLYPPVFSQPSQPVHHWPTIVMIITDRATELAADRLESRAIHLHASIFVPLYGHTYMSGYIVTLPNRKIELSWLRARGPLSWPRVN